LAESSIGFNTDGVGDGTVTGYTSVQWRNFIKAMLIDDNDLDEYGVFYGQANALAVTNTADNHMSVDTGMACVHGLLYFNTAAVALDLTTPVVDTTGWRIVLRASWAAIQTVRATVIMSADGTAAIPALTQVDGTTWDLPLAEGTITTLNVVALTDDRKYITGTGRFDATAVGRARMADAWFDAATVIAKFAEDSFTEANLRWLVGANQITNAVLLDLVLDGAFADSAATRALFANSIWTHTQIVDRTRTLWVPCVAGYNSSDSTPLTGTNFQINNGWTFPDAKNVYGYGTFQVPSDFASTMTVTPYIQANGGGNIYSSGEVCYGAENEVYNTHTDSEALGAEAITGGVRFENGHGVISMAAAAIGDFVTLAFYRNGAHANDTLSADVYFMGWKVSYTADM